MQHLTVCLLTLLVVTATCAAQLPDPLIGYVISANESSWRTGGQLSSIRPTDLSFPDEDVRALGVDVSAHASYADYYRVRGMEGYGASFRRSVAGSAIMRGRNRVAWSAQLTSETCANRVSFATGTSRQTASGGVSTWLTGLGGAVRLSPLVIGSALRIGPDQRPEPVAGIGVELRKTGVLEVFWERRLLQFDANLLWREESAGFELTGLREGVDSWLRLEWLRPLRVELRASRHLWVREDEVSLATTLEPWGDDWSYHGFAALDKERWTALAGLRGWSARLQAYGMKGDMPYAKFTRADLDIRAVFSSLEVRPANSRAKWVGEVEQLEWTGVGRGHVEFWPFTSGLVDLLGLRRYFIADASGHLWRLHLAAQSPLSAHWSGGAGVNVVDARQSAVLRHWQPEFLGFGVTDERFEELRLYRMIATMASLSAAYHRRSWAIEYTFHQIIPIKNWYHPSGEQPFGPPAAGGTPSRKYGGAFHQLSFRWHY